MTTTIYIVETRRTLWRGWSILAAYTEESLAHKIADAEGDDEEWKPLGRVREVDLIVESGDE